MLKGQAPWRGSTDLLMVRLIAETLGPPPAGAFLQAPSSPVLETARCQPQGRSIRRMLVGELATCVELAEAMLREEVVAILQNAFKEALNKFEKHWGQYPTKSFLKALRCFDPAFIKNNRNRDIIMFNAVKEFHEPSGMLLNEWAAYCQFADVFVKDPDDEFDLNRWWEEMAARWPTLGTIALDYIWLMPGNGDVERSFSDYNNIFTERRRMLGDEATKGLCMLYFNHKSD